MGGVWIESGRDLFPVGHAVVIRIERADGDPIKFSLLTGDQSETGAHLLAGSGKRRAEILPGGRAQRGAGLNLVTLADDRSPFQRDAAIRHAHLRLLKDRIRIERVRPRETLRQIRLAIGIVVSAGGHTSGLKELFPDIAHAVAIQIDNSPGGMHSTEKRQQHHGATRHQFLMRRSMPAHVRVPSLVIQPCV